MERVVGRGVFRGVFASDELPAKRARGLYIVNADPSTLPGSHWMALTVENDGGSTFFDSYGYPPSRYNPEILRFMANERYIIFHTTQLQHDFSSACGHHSVFYLIHRVKGLSYARVLSLYTDNTVYNDKMVIDFVKRYKDCIHCVKIPRRRVSQMSRPCCQSL